LFTTPALAGPASPLVDRPRDAQRHHPS
jgi:hypothetical protein